MSELTTTEGQKTFYDSLVFNTLKVAKRLSIEIPPTNLANSVFSYLIMERHREYGSQVAVLIDEFDAPITSLSDKPDEAKQARAVLRDFYRQLKANDEHISFAFMTGVSKYEDGGLYSAVNNAFDIAEITEFGALTGFTGEEIKRHFGMWVRQAADFQKMSEEALLDEMRRRFKGFCFDGETIVYNPYSILLFFGEKKFDNFNFNSGASK
jgi:hypothetical protein